MQPELTIMHLTSSRFYGGPERQMIGLARALRLRVKTVFASFSESGLNKSFLDEARHSGFTGVGLRYDTPRLLAARHEIFELVNQNKIDVLICHGYKAGMVGWFAAKKAGIPVIAVSRGWTRESVRVRIYELLDRLMLRRTARVVCVSKAQAEKVRSAGVSAERIVVIHNSIDVDRFATVDPAFRQKLLEFFPTAERPNIKFVIASAGRLSPEKGFDILIEAARVVSAKHPQVGFILFGEGPLRESLVEKISLHGLQNHFILAGFCSNLDALLPHLDLFVQSSHTEGMPNVILEALAAGVPVVATSVGGTVEIIDNGMNGDHVSPGSAPSLAQAMIELMNDPDRRAQYAQTGRCTIAQRFGFAGQAASYRQLFDELKNGSVTS